MSGNTSIFDDYSEEGNEERGYFKEQEDAFHRDHTIDMFEQAGRGEDLAYALSIGLYELHLNACSKSRPRLTPEQRLRTLSAVERAYRAAWRLLPADYPRCQVYLGMQAAARMVEHWTARLPLERDGAIYDAMDLVRCLRNDLHNISITKAMAERAHRRAINIETPGPSTVFDDPATDPPAIAFVAAA